MPRDLSREVSGADIDREISRMGLGRVNASLTKGALTVLRRRAATRAPFQRVTADSAFGGCQIELEGIGMRVRLARPGAS